MSTGTIQYDEEAEPFIFWGVAKQIDQLGNRDIYWYWTGSPDLKEWVYLDRRLAIDNYSGNQGITARYFDYHALDDDRIVLIMEWDEDGDSRGDLFIWDYRDDPKGDSSVR